MRILSFDPGYTTGIAIYGDDEKEPFDAFLTVTRTGLFRKGFLNHIISLAKPDVVLVEALPTNLVNSEMLRIHSYITHWFVTAGYSVEIIKPSEWKKWAARVEVPGQHARDAATMAAWWVKYRD